MKPPVVPVTVREWNRGPSQPREDFVAVEEPLEIRVARTGDGNPIDTLSVTMRTPGHDDELALGFLFGEGVLSSMTQVLGTELGQGLRGATVTVRVSAEVGLDHHRLERHVVTTSACGVCGKTSLEALGLDEGGSVAAFGSFPAGLVPTLPRTLAGAQPVFDRTGGLHAAGLFDGEGRLLSVREDVGRHNAVDKLLGAELATGRLPFTSLRVLVVSGRASFELVHKARRAGIAVFAAVGAPSSLAVEVARAAGMTLLGFVRGERFNVYCGGERLEPQSVYFVE